MDYESWVEFYAHEFEKLSDDWEDSESGWETTYTVKPEEVEFFKEETRYMVKRESHSPTGAFTVTIDWCESYDRYLREREPVRLW